MITSVSLENWRSHDNTTLNFRKGTNLLVGIMGSGKSSVLDGISFALFGTFPSLEHKKVSLENLIRHDKLKAKAAIKFEWKGEKYEIVREVRRELKKQGASSDAEARKEGKLAERGQKAVTKYVEQLLQVDYDLFSRAIYSEQNGIDRFLTMDPGKRKEEMDQLLGLDRFETARSNVVKIINIKRSVAKELEAKFSAQRLQDAKFREREAQEKSSRLAEEEKSAEESRKKWSGAEAKAGKAYSELKGKKERHDALRDSVAGSKMLIAHLGEELQGKQPSAELLTQVQERTIQLEKQAGAAKAAYKGLLSAKGTAEKEAAVLGEKQKEAKSAGAELEKIASDLKLLLGGKTPAELEEGKKALEKEALALAAKAQSLSSEAAKLDEGMKRLSEGKQLSRCPVCRSPLSGDGVEHVLVEYRSEIESKKSEWKKASEEAKAMLKKAEALGAAVRSVQRLEERAALFQKKASQQPELAEKIGKLRLAVQEAEKIALEAERNTEKLEKQSVAVQEELRRMQETLKKKERLEKAKDTLSKSEAALLELNFSEKEYEQARRDLEEAKLFSEKAAMAAKSALEQRKGAEEMLAMARKERAELESTERSLVGMAKLIEELSIYKNALVETQALLRSEVVDAINVAMGESWKIIYPYGDYTGVRMVAHENGYEFEVYDGAWRTAGLVSGGERASIALSLRIALATVLTPNLSMLILDEPTHNLDREAVSFLAHALQYNLPELVEQSFVITHDEGLMGSEFASTYKMKREKKGSAPTEAEEI